MQIGTPRLSKAIFNYYLLKINTKTTLEQITAKLISLQRLDDKLRTIVLEFDGLFIPSDLIFLVERVKAIAQNLDFTICAIQEHPGLVDSSIVNIPLVNYSNITECDVKVDTLIVEDPVRSGMRIEHNADIIVTSFVSDNAEIISSGNIHVYGEARGRLIAGNEGDKSKRIFAAKFNAAFISIGGIEKLIEGLYKSYDTFPVIVHSIKFDISKIISATGDVLAMGFIIVSPIIMTILVLDLILGIISRAAPQINAFQVSYTIKPTVGLLLLLLLLTTFMEILTGLFNNQNRMFF